MKILNKNIRATSLKEFWGGGYQESLYLWEGAKHNLTLDEMEKITEETLGDLFAEPKEIIGATNTCKQIFFKMLPRLAAILNKIAGLRLPDKFWTTAFGYWFYRHICIVFEKYSYLSTIDIDHTAIKLLKKDCFYVPYDHYDYVYCFCNDFGVQQLVSQYYYLFSKREFPVISLRYKEHSVSQKTNTKLIARKSILGHARNRIRNALDTLTVFLGKKADSIVPRIAIYEVYSTPDLISTLISGSSGDVNNIKPPCVNNARSINEHSRRKLLSIEFENDFEKYLVQTFFYCIPQMFVERFRTLYNAYKKDIKNKRFTHIVSESWISDISSSIYAAIAQNMGINFISHEHGSGAVFDQTSLCWIDILAADTYLTVGWKSENEKVRQGGFICRDIKPYEFQPSKKSVLFVARTSFPYLMEYFINFTPNSKMILELNRIRKFYNLLPVSLSNRFVLRPRREANFWDTEYALDVKNKNITVDNGNFSDSIANAVIVIIDHLSTGAAEIFLRKIPCLLLLEKELAPPIGEELVEVFVELKRCGVMHDSVESAVSHLVDVYNDVQHWWESGSVQSAVNMLIQKTLALPSKTIDYLFSLSKL